MTKSNRLSTRAGIRLSLEHVEKAQEGIVGVSAFIHRVHMFARDISYDDISRVFGDVKYHQRKNNKSHHMRQYAYSSYLNFKGRKITMYSSPDQGFLPLFMFTITNHKQSTLYHLSQALPCLEMSTAEYTIDLICKSSESASMLFYVLRRYMYFRNHGHTTMRGGDFNGVNVNRSENCVYHVWNCTRNEKDVAENMNNYQKKKKKKTDITIYERGPDTSRVGIIYPYETIDRVRIEFHLDRDNFTNLGILFLHEFVKDNKFSFVTEGKVNFKVFEKSDKLPRYYENYKADDEDGNSESFQQEYYHAKENKLVVNLPQCTADATFMEPIKKMIIDAIRSFDTEWKRKYAMHVFNTKSPARF